MTAYGMRISDWSSDVCSSDLHLDDLRKDARRARAIAFGEHVLAHFDERRDLDRAGARFALDRQLREQLVENRLQLAFGARIGQIGDRLALKDRIDGRDRLDLELAGDEAIRIDVRSEEHTSELQSLMRISYAGF